MCLRPNQKESIMDLRLLTQKPTTLDAFLVKVDIELMERELLKEMHFGL